MRYRRLPPVVVLKVIVTALVVGQCALQTAAEQHEAGGPAARSVSARLDMSGQVRDQSSIFTQPGERP